MRDLAEKWSVAPDWRNATIEVPGLKIGAVTGLHQRLVSGDLAAWAEASGFDGPAVGAFGLAEGKSYSVRLARDLLLAVSTTYTNSTYDFTIDNNRESTNKNGEFPWKVWRFLMTVKKVS